MRLHHLLQLIVPPQALTKLHDGAVTLAPDKESVGVGVHVGEVVAALLRVFQIHEDLGAIFGDQIDCSRKGKNCQGRANHYHEVAASPLLAHFQFLHFLQVLIPYDVVGLEVLLGQGLSEEDDTRFDGTVAGLHALLLLSRLLF
uniref:Uncharacterized protein n=1 Tax=Strombidium rassoulzadegani TaxID=1082188 RepID=A0A7S3FV83_9SPIT